MNALVHISLCFRLGCEAGLRHGWPGVVPFTGVSGPYRPEPVDSGSAARGACKGGGRADAPSHRRTPAKDGGPRQGLDAAEVVRAAEHGRPPHVGGAAVEKDALLDWIKIPLPRSVALSACRFCDEWVQVTHFCGEVVFGRNWPQTVRNYDLHIGDVVEFKIQAFVIQMKIYNGNSSTARLYTCQQHG